MSYLSYGCMWRCKLYENKSRLISIRIHKREKNKYKNVLILCLYTFYLRLSVMFFYFGVLDLSHTKKNFFSHVFNNGVDTWFDNGNLSLRLDT